ncbi:MAG: alpha-galactosidase [Firmicutes bacterium]|nr:alpha-galactosidase [Bacillota bacterium]
MGLKIKGGSPNAEISIDALRENDGILTFDVKMIFDREEIPEQFTISFSIPNIEMYSVWSPSLSFNRSLGVDWSKRKTNSRLASFMPIQSLISLDGKNRTTIAVSDAITPTFISSGVCEETACIDIDIAFFTVKVAPLKEYTATVRIDTRSIPYYDSIYDIVSWWENECGYKPAYIPEHAKLPMNSLWYSYHQQLDVDDIIKECRLSKAIGMDTVIVDDGWQTDDNNRGYQFCGDWKVASTKIPNMREFVSRVHETGMKIMLWFSVPFVGKDVESYEHFKDMLLDGSGDGSKFFSLDPRYKEVREFLVNIYAKALREWGFDGLKLDFIDSFVLYGKSLEYDERRDFASLEDAIDALLKEITSVLKTINPDVLIEFRQSYVGPAIRKYGNILRVGDCPNDSIKNRLGVVDLRFTSGKTAVHSDMLMWNYDDTVQSAALQFIAALYSVPQISVKIAKLSDEQKKMLAFYLSFWRENRDILINGKLMASAPESAYSKVWSEKDNTAIFTCFSDTVVNCSPYTETVAINSSNNTGLIIKSADQKAYTVLNCMGETISNGTVHGALCEIDVPIAGMIRIG